MRNVLFGGLVGLSMALAGQSFARDMALLIANENYDNGRDIRAADDLLDVEDALQQAGFEIIKGEDATVRQMRSLLAEARARANGSGRVIVAVSGHFIRTRDEAWVLGVDANRPSARSVGRQGLNLAALTDLAATSPGQAVVLLGSEDRNFPTGSGVALGGVMPVAPQGVTIVTGDAGEVAAYLEEGLLNAGQSIAESVAGFPQLKASGFIAPLIPFMAPELVTTGPIVSRRPEPGRRGVTVGPATQPSVGSSAASDDVRFWRLVRQSNSVGGYQQYLKQFPNGAHADEARAALRQLGVGPERDGEVIETALRLDRGDRRQIQRELTLLGYDTRGIDGLFGRGSRAAISQFQRDNGFDATGYLSRPMLERLALLAKRRTVELEEEAERRRIALERQDRAYWRSTGALGDEPGLRDYLDRYPDGLYAEIATVRLRPFEEAAARRAEALDRADWDAAARADTIDGYRSYLATQPDGAFVEQAKVRIGELDFAARNSEALQAAQRNEERLGMNQATRRLVEDRLMRLGLKPGPIDGVFDERTRRSIRRYQEARKLQKTGYLNQATAVRLMADSFLR